MLAAGILLGREGRARGKDDLAVGPSQRVLERNFALGERVREGEDDRTLVEARHLADNGLVERAPGRAQADQRRRLDKVDHLLKSLELPAGVVVPAEEFLVLGQTVTTVVGDEALCVDQPEPAAGLLFRDAVADEE